MQALSKHEMRSLKMYFPWLLEQAVGYFKNNSYEITVKLDDGSYVLINKRDHSFRNLPLDSNGMTDEEFRREFGRRLENTMYHKRISQIELSQRSGIPQPVISNYIRGLVMPSFVKVDKLAKALGCSADEFRYFEKEMMPFVKEDYLEYD